MNQMFRLDVKNWLSGKMRIKLDKFLLPKPVFPPIILWKGINFERVIPIICQTLFWAQRPYTKNPQIMPMSYAAKTNGFTLSHYWKIAQIILSLWRHLK